MLLDLKGIIISFKDVEMEKGNTTKSPYGNFVEEKSYVIVVNDENEFKYYVVALDESGFAIPFVNAANLDATDITTNAKKIEENIHSTKDIIEGKKDNYLYMQYGLLFKFNETIGTNNNIIKIPPL